MHRSPGGVTCEASFPARGRHGHAGHPILRAMRRWVCIVALLAGFCRGRLRPRRPRLREPVAVERLIETRRRGARGLVPDGGLVVATDRMTAAAGTAPAAPGRPRSHVARRRGRSRIAGRRPIASWRRRGVGRPAAARRRRRAAPTPSRSSSARPDTLDPGRPGRHRQRRDLRPAVREPDRDRRRSSRPGRRSPRRGTSATAGHRSSSTSGPDLTFSDGSPITADDVVRSWLRIIDPAHPSPLVSLMGDVDGRPRLRPRRVTTDPATRRARRRRASTSWSASTRPATDFPTIVASPTFAIVPPGDRRRPAARSSPAPASSAAAATSSVGRPTRQTDARPPTTTTGPAGRRSGRSSSSTTSAGGAPSPRSRPATST